MMMRPITVLFALLFCLVEARPLPLYTARSGRICDNCHSTPFKNQKQRGFKDPALEKRKCNLSCATCHVDAGGGGLRRVSGRYYGFATLPVYNSEKRPYWDNHRTVAGLVNYLVNDAGDKKVKKKKKRRGRKKRRRRRKRLPEKFQQHKTPPVYTSEDAFVAGRALAPGKKRTDYAPDYGIYGKLNADPFFTLGGNFRAAYLHTRDRDVFFPMQADLGAALHPVEHLTAAATVGMIGQAKKKQTLGFKDRLVLRNAYLMLHELPYQAYLRAGTFMPVFGVRTDDHTAFTRKHFELDASKRYNGVIGAEAGFAANYPYLSFSVFSNNTADSVNPSASKNFSLRPHGIGGALNTGWRDLAWGAGASAMVKKRDGKFNGDLVAAGFDGYFNVGCLKRNLPLVIMAEFVFGSRSGSGRDRTFYANFIEISWLVFNGVNVKLNHHFYDADFSIKNDEIGRLGFGLEYNPWGFLKIYAEYRFNWQISEQNRFRQGPFVNPADLSAEGQFILLVHLYF